MLFKDLKLEMLILWFFYLTFISIILNKTVFTCGADLFYLFILINLVCLFCFSFNLITFKSYYEVIISNVVMYCVYIFKVTNFYLNSLVIFFKLCFLSFNFLIFDLLFYLICCFINLTFLKFFYNKNFWYDIFKKNY